MGKGSSTGWIFRCGNVGILRAVCEQRGLKASLERARAQHCKGTAFQVVGSSICEHTALNSVSCALQAAWYRQEQ